MIMNNPVELFHPPNTTKCDEHTSSSSTNTTEEDSHVLCPRATARPEIAVSTESRSDRICDSILDVIGDTPLVRLHRVGCDLLQDSSSGRSNGIRGSETCPRTSRKIEICCKCEFLNAGGSVKDRIGRQMVLEAESSNRIQPGDTLIEPTSGNTGIGLALTAAIKGYRCIITMPEKMSKEKVDILKALGAEIVRTPTEAAFDAPDSHISIAKRLQAELPNSHILDQYSNPANPGAHYRYTAEEIWRQTGGKIDMIVAGAGTGGTLTGIARRLKELNPKIIVVGVDPEGSILAVPDSLNDAHRLESYHVEGIGYDFIPQALDRDLVDYWYKSNDHDSLVMMRRLIRDEGLLCGGSSGAAVSCAIQAAVDHFLRPAGDNDDKCDGTQLLPRRVVVILPDSVRNYMTKALSNDWMSDHGFVDGTVIREKSFGNVWWANRKVHDLPINTPLSITGDVRCKDAIALLKQEGFDMVPVLDSSSAVIGVVTEGNMINRLLSGRCRAYDSVSEAGVIYKTFHKFSMHDTLATIAQALDHDPFVLIVTEQRCFSSSSNSVKSVSSNKRSRSYSLDRKGDEDDHYESAALSSSKGSLGGGATLVRRSVVSGIVSRIDLLDFISRNDEQ